MNPQLCYERIHKQAVIILAAAILSVGCNSAPRVLHHPAPEFVLNTLPFEQAGCIEGATGRRECPPDSLLAQAGCQQVSDPGLYLGGLDPAYPINVCWLEAKPGEQPSDELYVYREGCLLPQFVRYVIWDNGQFHLIANQADLAAAYAPITTKDEALSYALAATGLAAYFDLQASDNLRYFQPQLEDTHVEVTPEGYVVHLYHYQLCGCGPHTTSVVDVLVREDGQIEELGRQPAFEDPAQDGLCID